MIFSSYWENFAQPIQIQLSKKQKKYSGIFIAFLKSLPNFEQFFKKDERQSLSFSEIIDSKKRGYLIAEKVLFQNSLHRASGWKAPMKYAPEKFYLILCSFWEKMSWIGLS